MSELKLLRPVGNPEPTDNRYCWNLQMQVVTFRLGIVEAVQQSTGRDMISKMKAEYLHSEELGTMTWEEFQAKFSAGESLDELR